jgi:hypothetical protein
MVVQVGGGCDWDWRETRRVFSTVYISHFPRLNALCPMTAYGGVADAEFGGAITFQAKRMMKRKGCSFFDGMERMDPLLSRFSVIHPINTALETL